MSAEQLLNSTVRRKAVILLGLPAVLLGLTVVRLGSRRPVQNLPAGSTLEIRVEQPLSSRTLGLGDVIEGKVISLRGNHGERISPPSMNVNLRCVAVRKAEEDARPGYLRLTIISLANPAGELLSVQTSTYSQWGEENASGSVNGRQDARDETGRGSMTSATSAVPSLLGNDAVITPDASLKFILLKPVSVDGLPSSL